MSVDVLQNKIRKLKNPVLLHLCLVPELVPPAFLEGKTLAQGYEDYSCALLQALAQSMPGVRVSFDSFAILGPEGLTALHNVLLKAKELQLYTVLDYRREEEPALAAYAAQQLLRTGAWPCDAVSLGIYAGSESVKPYIAAADGKAVFVTLKTGNRSGSELQDLMTGGRLVYTAAADMVSLWGEGKWGRCGYSNVAGIAGAVNAQSLKNLRQKYGRMFLLVEGLETSGANAKNCAAAFDRMGHGAVCCPGSSVLAAWKESEQDPIEAACEAVERWKRNLGRYIAVL